MGSSKDGTRPSSSATRPSASGGIASPPRARARGVRPGRSTRPSQPPPRRGASPMPDPRLGRVFASLLPRRITSDAFEPAWEDVRIAYLTRRQRAQSSLGRATLYAGYLFLAVVVFLDCWRLALAGVFRSSAEQRHVHPIIAEPKQTERLHMVLYLIRHAFRQLVREPAFTVAALLTLALGVGANVAVFAVVEAVLLRPLPYPDADRLVILNHRDKRTGITKEFIAIGDYVDLVSRQGAFESLAAYGRGQTSIV